MSTKKDLDRLLQRFIEERQLPGAALSVYLGEEPVFESFVGYRDFARSRPLTPDTIFRIHSITKAVSALCGMMEYERGTFLMDEPVYAYLPEYRHLKVSIPQPDGSWRVKAAEKPMLIKHLFNMNVGFYAHDGSPTDLGLQEVQRKLGGSKFAADYDLMTEIRALPEVPMLFEPGTHFQYGYGIAIMAAIVETVSGMSIGQYMQKKIFEPLGMDETAFRFRPGWRERLADVVIHPPAGGVKLCDDFFGDPTDSMYRENAKYEAADAGLLSTLHDLQVFSGMLACSGTWKGERIIGRKTIDMMRQNLLTDQMMKEFQTVGDVEGYGYGYGVRTMVDPAAGLCNGSVGEFGWLGVAGAWMMADPAEKLSAAFMIQDMMPGDECKYYNDRLRAAIYGLL